MFGQVTGTCEDHTRCRKHNVLAGNRPYFVSGRSPTLRVLLEPLRVRRIRRYVR